MSHSFSSRSLSPLRCSSAPLDENEDEDSSENKEEEHGRGRIYVAVRVRPQKHLIAHREGNAKKDGSVLETSEKQDDSLIIHASENSIECFERMKTTRPSGSGEETTKKHKTASSVGKEREAFGTSMLSSMGSVGVSSMAPGMGMGNQKENHTNTQGKSAKRFVFDKVFDANASQTDLMTNVGEKVLKGIFQGFNGSVVCYGQSGSGKTHTILGAQGGQALLHRKKNVEWMLKTESSPSAAALLDENEKSHSRQPPFLSASSSAHAGDAASSAHEKETLYRHAEDVGLFPRLLQALFAQIESWNGGPLTSNASQGDGPHRHAQEGEGGTLSPSLTEEETEHQKEISESRKTKRNNWGCSVHISAVELYNEELRDLLPDDLPFERADAPKKGNKRQEKKCSISDAPSAKRDSLVSMEDTMKETEPDEVTSTMADADPPFLNGGTNEEEGEDGFPPAGQENPSKEELLSSPSLCTSPLFDGRLPQVRFSEAEEKRVSSDGTDRAEEDLKEHPDGEPKEEEGERETPRTSAGTNGLTLDFPVSERSLSLPSHGMSSARGRSTLSSLPRMRQSSSMHSAVDEMTTNTSISTKKEKEVLLHKKGGSKAANALEGQAKGKKDTAAAASALRASHAGKALHTSSGPPPPKVPLRIHFANSSKSEREVGASMWVEGLRRHPLHSFHEAMAAISEALHTRVVSATGLNAQSNRSHTIFFVHLCQLERISSHETMKEEVQESNAAKNIPDGNGKTMETDESVTVGGREGVEDMQKKGRRPSSPPASLSTHDPSFRHTSAKESCSDAVQKDGEQAKEEEGKQIEMKQKMDKETPHEANESEIRQKYSVLTFADLAGSERVSHSGAEGARLKEAKNINLSLTLLGTVIQKLAELNSSTPAPAVPSGHKKRDRPQPHSGIHTARSVGEKHHQKNKHNGSRRHSGPSVNLSHIPYRDSKLTQLLKDSFGGNSMSFFLCTISTEEKCRVETLSTLRFAQLAKVIENTATSNTMVLGDSTKQYEREIALWKRKYEQKRDRFVLLENVLKRLLEQMQGNPSFSIPPALLSSVPLSSLSSLPLQRFTGDGGGADERVGDRTVSFASLQTTAQGGTPSIVAADETHDKEEASSPSEACAVSGSDTTLSIPTDEERKATVPMPHAATLLSLSPHPKMLSIHAGVTSMTQASLLPSSVAKTAETGTGSWETTNVRLLAKQKSVESGATANDDSERMASRSIACTPTPFPPSAPTGDMASQSSFHSLGMATTHTSSSRGAESRNGGKSGGSDPKDANGPPHPHSTFIAHASSPFRASNAPVQGRRRAASCTLPSHACMHRDSRERSEGEGIGEHPRWDALREREARLGWAVSSWREGTDYRAVPEEAASSTWMRDWRMEDSEEEEEAYADEFLGSARCAAAVPVRFSSPLYDDISIDGESKSIYDNWSERQSSTRSSTVPPQLPEPEPREGGMFRWMKNAVHLAVEIAKGRDSSLSY